MKYLPLATTLRDVIPMMELLENFWDSDYTLMSTEHYCNFFEDISGALEIACLPKMQTSPKAMNVAPHHFR